jgi:hypothetical protein
MAWDIEYTDEFESWWEDLRAEAQIDVDTVVGLLEGGKNHGKALQRVTSEDDT